FVLPDPTPPRPGTEVGIEIESPELCSRFSATVLGGVHVGPSPQWVQRRLTLAGMRPINNVVDASNYVMLELGQPTHPYDLARRSEASVRFERGCDPESVPHAIARFCELLPDANVQAGPFVVDAPRYLPTPHRVEVRTARVNAILGTDLTDAQIRRYLTPIG